MPIPQSSSLTTSNDVNYAGVIDVDIRIVFKAYKRFMPAVQVSIDRLRSKSAIPFGRGLRVEPFRHGSDPVMLGLVGTICSVGFIIEADRTFVVGMEDCIAAARRFRLPLQAEDYDGLDWAFGTFVKETYGIFPEYTFRRHLKMGQHLRVLHMIAEKRPSLRVPKRPKDFEVSLVEDINQVTGCVWHPGSYTTNPALKHWPDKGLLDPAAWS